MLLLAILISGCVSTTVFRTYPTRADVYVSGEKKGRTPYYYSDRKIVGSSTPVTFRKKGYNDLNIILKRDEALDVGPFVGGLFVLIPFLWVTKYDSLHAYQLERNLTDSEMSYTISNPVDSSIAINHNALIKHDSIAGIAAVSSQIAYEPEKTAAMENDSLQYAEDNSGQQAQVKTTPTHIGFGGGFCFPGSIWGMRYTFISSNNWGGSIGMNSNIYKSQNVPSDYYDDAKRIIAPKDYLNSFTFNVVKSFNSPIKSRRYGFEFGPSWVIYREAKFKNNANPTWPDYTYHKYHSRENTVGLSLRAKMEFLFSNSSGLELAMFTNINGIRSIFGFEVDMMFGRMGYVK
jgi:hypothetical protein